MELKNIKNYELTKRQLEKIYDNLKAYENNFSPIEIKKEDYGKGYYIFREGEKNYIQYCYTIDYLNGWLYGAVQCINKVIK